jgi:chaperone BCS1
LHQYLRSKTSKLRSRVEECSVFFSPDRREYYRDRGIPYRRGYLFHGPPGTGKTSLALAISAEFQLFLYVIHLNEPGLTDANFISLLQTLPSRSLLLIEDIDSAGLTLHGGKKQTNVGEGDGELIAGLTRTGFINAIDGVAVDGVASPEGYILFMATNHIDRLDPAAIRKGRVDYRLELPLATKENVQQMFLRMYADVHGIGGLANAFKDAVPENEFSAAEIQDFLMGY